MPIGLRGNFEYRGTRRGMRSEEAEGTDESGEGAWEFVKGVDSRRPMIRRLFRMPGRAVRRDASIKHVFVEHTLELDRADLLTAKQEQVDVVLSLPSTEIAADKLLIREGAGLTPSGTNRATISVEPVVVGPNPVVQGTEATSTGADLASERSQLEVKNTIA
ncbi:hypothetical protein GBA52_016936 [Prunus armeniaca]|nr:hypothetical protein GBA52_016936 [Prunus armeniaca]